DFEPKGPPPDRDSAPMRFATAADIRRMVCQTPWPWEGWIPPARIVGIAAYEGVGKTRFALDLARRVWHGREWPDGQPMTLPSLTPTIWVCADGQQDDIAETLPAFGLPDEAVVFPASPDEPYDGTSLDDPEMVRQGGTLESAIVAVKPAFLII